MNMLEVDSMLADYNKAQNGKQNYWLGEAWQKKRQIAVLLTLRTWPRSFNNSFCCFYMFVRLGFRNI